MRTNKSSKWLSDSSLINVMRRLLYQIACFAQGTNFMLSNLSQHAVKFISNISGGKYTFIPHSRILDLIGCKLSSMATFL